MTLSGNGLVLAWVVGALFAWLNPKLSNSAWATITIVSVIGIFGLLLLQHNAVYSIPVVTLTSVGIFAAFKATTWDILVPIRRPVTFVADYSYSLYLIHFSILVWMAALAPDLRGIGFLALGFIISNVLAIAWWFLLERQHRRYVYSCDSGNPVQVGHLLGRIPMTTDGYDVLREVPTRCIQGQADGVRVLGSVKTSVDPRSVASSLRLDIQGLRALAVGLVVVFHLAPAAMPGGYVGVDVFFVISGFLITAHLLREVAVTGTVKLGRFWARRARRLLPAALVVLAVSAATVVLVLPPTMRIQNLWEVAFSAIYILNWNLAANSVDYLGAHNSPSIAQHYWSLSVEEQFYILWPLLIIGAVWIAAKLFKTSPRKGVFFALILVLVTSLTFSVYETTRSQPSAYFLTTTRAWEFAVGGIFAMAPAIRLRTPIHAAVSWVLLGAVAGSALLFNAQTSFPGWVALIPVLGTAGLLWVGDSESAWSPQYVSHSEPIQFIGDTSYSIYLWHWPAIVVFIALEGRRPGWKWMFILTVAIIALAWLSKRFVEDPVRHGPGLLKRNGPTFLMTAAAMLVVLVIAVIPAQVLLHQQRVYAETIAAAVADESGCFGAYALTNECTEPY